MKYNVIFFQHVSGLINTNSVYADFSYNAIIKGNEYIIKWRKSYPFRVN